MKTNVITRPLLIAVVVAVVGCAASSSSDSDSETAGGKSTYGAKQLAKCQAKFEEINSVLDLDAAEKKALVTVQQTQMAQLEQWYGESGVELVALRKEALEATRDRDLAKFREMDADGKKKRVAELAEEERVLLEDYTRSLLGAMDASNVSLYKAHVISEQLLNFLQPLELTDGQVVETRSLATKVISQMGASESWRGQGTIDLEKDVRATVLTAEQKKVFEELGPSKGMERLEWSN